MPRCPRGCHVGTMAVTHMRRTQLVVSSVATLTVTYGYGNVKLRQQPFTGWSRRMIEIALFFAACALIVTGIVVTAPEMEE